MTAPDFLAFRRSNSVFSGLAALEARDFNLTGSGEPERLHGARVSSDLFSILGVRPELGRSFIPEEDEEGRDAVVVISHALWERRFGSDPTITGRTILLDGRPHAVVGVMPADLLFPVGRQLDRYITFGPRVDLWKPIAFTTGERESEGDFNFAVIGRLKSDVSIAAARQQMDVLTQQNLERIKKLAPANFEMFTRLTPLHEVFTGNSRRGLLLLEAAVGLLLLIACVNLANVLMARASSREAEFVVRAALGAGRRRLIRQLLTESFVVTSLGGAVGVVFAAWTGPLLLAYGPSIAAAREWTLAGPVLAFAAMMTVATALLFRDRPCTAYERRGRSQSSTQRLTRGDRQTASDADCRRSRSLHRAACRCRPAAAQLRQRHECRRWLRCGADAGGRSVASSEAVHSGADGDLLPRSDRARARTAGHRRGRGHQPAADRT